MQQFAVVLRIDCVLIIAIGTCFHLQVWTFEQFLKFPATDEGDACQNITRFQRLVNEFLERGMLLWRVYWAVYMLA